jgi:hypothetical protein
VRSLRVESPDIVLTVGSLMDRISYGKARLYQGVLVQCQSYHGNYVFCYDRVAMLDDDGMTLSTQVPAVRCAWVPTVVSCHARHEMSSLL